MFAVSYFFRFVNMARTTTRSELSCEVIHQYVAANADELTITPGEILVVLVADAGDGWMEGRNLNGQRGLFPAGYVQLFE